MLLDVIRWNSVHYSCSAVHPMFSSPTNETYSSGRIGISVAILFSIGDVVSALKSPTKFPIIAVFHVATQSKAATTALMVALNSILVFGTFGALAAASRMAWAFARDNGLPFSDFFAHVSIETEFAQESTC